MLRRRRRDHHRVRSAQHALHAVHDARAAPLRHLRRPPAVHVRQQHLLHARDALSTPAWKAPIRPTPMIPIRTCRPLPSRTVLSLERSNVILPPASRCQDRCGDRNLRAPERRRWGQPTIIDIAERAGVSKSLVSLVLRGSPRVSETSRRVVLEAAAALGYRPNAMARSLVSRCTNVLGVVLSDLHNTFFAEVLDGIDGRAREEGYRTLLASGAPVAGAGVGGDRGAAGAADGGPGAGGAAVAVVADQRAGRCRWWWCRARCVARGVDGGAERGCRGCGGGGGPPGVAGAFAHCAHRRRHRCGWAGAAAGLPAGDGAARVEGGDPVGAGGLHGGGGRGGGGPAAGTGAPADGDLRGERPERAGRAGGADAARSGGAGRRVAGGLRQHGACAAGARGPDSSTSRGARWGLRRPRCCWSVWRGGVRRRRSWCWRRRWWWAGPPRRRARGPGATERRRKVRCRGS